MTSRRSHAPRPSTSTSAAPCTAAGWRADGERLEFHITADAFLRHMVRVLVGTMLDRPDPEYLAALLAGRPRSDAGRTAPPHGLTLESVTY